MYIRLHNAARDFPSYLPLLGIKGFLSVSDHVTEAILPLPYCVREQLWRRFDVVAGALNGKWLERDSGMHLDCFKFLDRDFPIAQRILTIANDDIISAALDHPGSRLCAIQSKCKYRALSP